MRGRNLSSQIVGVMASLLLAFGLASAQGVGGTITGIVRDEQGAAIPDVALSVRNVETGFVRRLTTNEAGRYSASGLPFGIYQLEASKPGFRSEVRTGIRLTVGQEVVLDLTLRVGQVEERVEVTGGAPLVETTTAALGELVDARKVRDLPLNGRDIVQLITLQTGVNVIRTDEGDILTGGKGTRLSVAGVRASGHIFMLDGTIINNLMNRVASNATGQLTGVETIQEFRVLTSSYSAEYPRVMGGAFNIVTKSGTNEWHGSLFHFLRNDNLDARNFFDREKPEFKRNQFGFSVGGPIRRDRHFAFGSYEGLRETLGLTVIRSVPDLEARRGILGGRSVEIHPAVVPYLNIWPQPTADPVPGDGSALFVGAFAQRGREDFFTVRTDWTLSSSDTLMVRYTFADSREFRISEEVFPEFPNRGQNRVAYVTIAETKALSPILIHDFRFGLARTTPQEVPDPANPHTELAFIPGQPIGTITISGFDRFGTDRNTPRRLTRNSFQYYDNLSLLIGRHSVRVGFAAERLQDNVISSSRARGEFTFSSLADFLRARPRTFEGLLPEASDFTRGYRQSLFGWYLQDEFRLTNRFALTYGLRHEIPTDPTEQHGRLNNLHDPMDPKITIGKPFVVSKRLFAPRLGFAWDLTGDGKTALRGGFGIFFDPFLAHHWWNSIVRLPPFAITARASGSAVSFPNALSGLRALARDAIFAVDFDHGQPYVYQYNLNLQREIFPQTVLTLAYVGSRGVHLGREADWNIGSPGNPTPRNPNFTRIRFRTFDANSIYNALQLGLNKRFSRGFQIQGSYTFSKSIDEASAELGRVEGGAHGQARTSDPFDRKRDRGLSNFDVRHNLVINATWDLPFGRGRRFGNYSSGVMEKLLGGWQVSGIATFSSGQPITPIIIVDLDRDGSDDNEQRPNLRPGRSPNPRIGRPERWFDPSAFFSLTPGTRGNLGRNTIIGPGVVLLDVGLMKTIPISERSALQFRLELFNLANHPNFATPPRSNLEIFNAPGPDAQPLPEVGRITQTSTTARQIQLALRLSF